MGQATWSAGENRPGTAGARLRRSIRVSCGLLLFAQVAVAAERIAANTTPEKSIAKPTVNGHLLVPVRRQLTFALRFAQKRIRTRPTCGALFSRFGVNGAQLFARVKFDGAAFETRASVCRDGVPAYTTIGSHRIRLCPGFSGITVPSAPVIQIHKALHSAGMTEKPADPNGLTAGEINRLVKASCGL